ncbi:MAG: serine hydrolase [Clostridia bacterium]|nr:serine hydrolase [Clostridia bacterium]
MFKVVSPESIGIKSAWIEKFIKHLQGKGLPMHDVVIMRGNAVCCEAYWKPFHKDFCHRQYSQTKSFTSIAIGLLEEEGKISLDDKIADYFRDKIKRKLPEYLENQTIRDMLMMTTTSYNGVNWLVAENKDMVDIYFHQTEITHPAGTIWRYDSNGSHILSMLVEKLSGKSLLAYLKEKLFNKMDAFQNAQILKGPVGESWGDSAMICTPNDMLSFARLVMNYGTWQGERLMNEQYLREATSALTALTEFGNSIVGYGYQIWKLRNNSFGFLGLGKQLTVCNPEKDIILVLNSDCQGSPYDVYGIIFDYYFEDIVENITETVLPEDPAARESLRNLCDSLTLHSIHGIPKTQIQENIDGKTFLALGENAQGITKFCFSFDGKNGGVFRYTNAQGDKELPFAINANEFCKFPQFGYSNEYGGLPTTDGYLYDCAVSAAWMDNTRFQIYVQVIDKYFGNCTMTFCFKDEFVGVEMRKYAEGFMEEYQGSFVAKQI